MNAMPTTSSADIDAFWRHCRDTHGITQETCHVGPFSDPKMAPYQDLLLDLVAQGKKRATARLDMEFARQEIPRRGPGDHWLVLSGDGAPRFLIRITDVDIRPFDQVTATFAAREGEGDESLEYWREVHRDYFVQQCAVWGVEWREDLDTCCEGFEVVETV